jgi:Flp pilus assembly protein TadG
MRIGRRHPRDRRGVTTVEAAAAYSVTLMLIMGITITGLGVFRYQQLASLSRAGARWASVHGPQYQSDQNTSAITSADVMNYLNPPSGGGRVVGLTPADLTCTLTMPTGSDTASTGTTTVSAGGNAVTSTTSNVNLANAGTATVKLSYYWVPEGWFSAITMSSISVVPVTY